MKAQKQQVKKVAPKLNKAEKLIVRCVKENNDLGYAALKGRALYLHVLKSVAGKLNGRSKLPPEYERALKTLAAELKL